MKYISTTIFLLAVMAFSAPMILAATSTSDTTATTSPASIQEVMETEDIDHGRISFNLGINRRISSSPSGLVDFEITPKSVLNTQLLELYVRKLALTEPVSEMVIDEKEVELTARTQGRLLGVIPVSLPYRVSVNMDNGIEEITIEDQSSWSWLATKTSPDAMVKDVQTRMSEKQYISTTQLKAHLLGEIIEVVTN